MLRKPEGRSPDGAACGVIRENVANKTRLAHLIDSRVKGLSCRSLQIVLLLFVLLLASGSALADWVDFSKFGGIAEYSVLPGEIRLNLRLKKSSLPTDAGLSGQSTASPPMWLAMRLPVIQARNGKPYTGRLQSLEHKTVEPVATPTGTSNGSEDYYEASLVYSMEKRLERFSIIPPEGATIGLVLLHRGIPVSDLMPWKKPLNLSLDWNDPWRSRFDDPEFVRRHAEPRSYLYLEPYEVRHEMLLRVKDFKPRLDLGLQDGHWVEEGEREALKKKIGDFLLAHNRLSVDGTDIQPQLDRVEFVRFDRSGIIAVGEHDRLESETALVGVMLAYLTDHPTRSLRLQWDMFGANKGERQVSLIKGKESFDGYMNPRQPFFDWSQEDSLDPAPPNEETSDLISLTQKTVTPKSAHIFFISWMLAALIFGLSLLLFKPRLVERGIVSTVLGLFVIVAVGLIFHPLPGSLAKKETYVPSALDEAQAKTLLQSLLHNAYRAFQLRDEEKAYDRLAKSLDGTLLDDIYLQQRKAILRQAKGLGGEGKVDRIEVLDSHVHGLGQQPGVVQVTSRWLAHGSVSHWGHAHERHNLYQARLILRNSNEGGWKIVGMEFLDGQRLEAGVSG